MDDDLAARLEAVLSDPGQMEKIGQMAKGLLGQMAPPDQESGKKTPERTAPDLDAGPDGRFLAGLGKAFTGGGRSRSAELLMAMKPYMRPEKQEKLDRAVRIARMVHIAGAVVRQYGGDGHGL